ncbi:MAG: TolC family protein [Alphaproteobacteria bacterium]|nr:TolC family protein [Alphaproteobacteria bacterium]
MVWILVAVAPVTGATAGELPLAEAETLAVDRDPLASRFQAKAEALSEKAIADGQLPDPEFKAGIMNLPENSFSRTQEAMTQLQVGVRQAFPRGDSLSLRTRKSQALAEGEQARRLNRRRKVVLEVRKSWLDLFYLTQATRVIAENKVLFQQLIDVTQSLYALGRSNQQDVLRAELELSLLEDKETEITAMLEMTRADLGKWVGPQHEDRPLPGKLAVLPSPPPLEKIEADLPDHPLMKVEDADLRASQTGVDLANELYKPKWMMDLTHGFRGGHNADRSSRDDFLSFMVTMDVPLFTENRQDRRLAASRKEAAAARFKRDDRLLELTRVLARQHAAWTRLGQRVALYDRAVLAQADQNVEASIKAYESDVTDFSGLMRAQITDLDTRLKGLQLRVERAKAQAGLLYLAGDAP